MAQMNRRPRILNRVGAKISHKKSELQTYQYQNVWANASIAAPGSLMSFVNNKPVRQHTA
jgi:hypothetical protein